MPSTERGKGWGGKRPGAGGKLLGAEPTVRRSVTLEPRHWQWLSAKGNASAALRELLGRAMDAPTAPDQDAAQLEWEQTRAELRRLRAVLEVAAEACRLREITPHLIDVLDAEGFATAPRAPDPETWSLPGRHEK